MSKPQSDAARWGERVARARELAERHPAAADVLLFYAEIAQFQKSLLNDHPTAARPGVSAEDVPLLDALHLDRVAAGLPALVALVQRVGTPALQQAAAELTDRGAAYPRHVLRAFRSPDSEQLIPPAHLFFAQVLLQPHTERLALSRRRNVSHDAPSTCPLCGSTPLAGVLREDGQAARRYLLCSLCLTEWSYRRILCPTCGEERFDALPVYTAEQFAHVRVEACDSCRAYIKTVDLSRDGTAVPIVDELAAAALDLWAVERGYRKLRRNLLGL